MIHSEKDESEPIVARTSSKSGLLDINIGKSRFLKAQ